MAPQPRLRIAYLTAGAAGMYCGSCLHDNALAAALIKRDVDVTLIPLYTPIRTDEENVSIDRIFFGGINVYLQEYFAPFRYLPRFLDRWLDRPWLVDRVSRRGIQVEANQLGSMTVSMLRGENGRQRKEVHRLADWLTSEIKPQLVNFSNMLVSGIAPVLKRKLNIPLVVTLQGDDLFLNDLKEPYKAQAFTEILRLAESIEGFIVHSNYYADYMSELLGIDRSKFHIVPLGLNANDLLHLLPDATQTVNRPVDRPPTVGYLARIAPEKGFALLVDAIDQLRRMSGMADVRLRAAGWLGAADKAFFELQKHRIAAMGWSDRFEYLGVVDREGKRQFLQSLDVLSVPTTYRDPKGLFVLESLAAGVPVVQPAHGAFPELLQSTGGGILTVPHDSKALAQDLYRILTNSQLRAQLASEGRLGVVERHSGPKMADDTLRIYRILLERHASGPSR